MQSPTDPLSAPDAEAGAGSPLPSQHTEILILPEGKILVHNLTPVMAVLLETLNPQAGAIRDRVAVLRDRTPIPAAAAQGDAAEVGAKAHRSAGLRHGVVVKADAGRVRT